MRLFVKQDSRGLLHLAFWARSGDANRLCAQVHSATYVAMTRLDRGSQAPTCLFCVREWWRTFDLA